MNFFRVYIRFADGVNERVGIGVAWLTAALV
ncbi:MAG: C4-dicarboxylate ABC transporter permease, partial [Candidatus Latescibacteria bacterium]|nr:C4-dicarboxylate ABC transporter permease [Candidatus Latescibacterota bacterium]